MNLSDEIVIGTTAITISTLLILGLGGYLIYDLVKEPLNNVSKNTKIVGVF